MGFERFGVVCHTKDAKVSEFIDWLERGKVMATRCRRCQTVYFPPKVDCPRCLVEDMEWVEISGQEGELLSYTVVHYGPAGFEDKAPYTMGLAQFPPGVKVLALLPRDLPEDQLRVGMKVKVVPVKLPPDRISYGLEPA